MTSIVGGQFYDFKHRLLTDSFMAITTAEGLTNSPNEFDRSMFSKLVSCTGQHHFVEHILSKKKRRDRQTERRRRRDSLPKKQRRIITSFNTGNGAEDCPRGNTAIVSSTQEAYAILPDN